MSENLWQQVESVTTKALSSGALLPIATDYQIIEQQNREFLLRTLNNLNRRKSAQERLRQAGNTHRNPFCPYEQQLYVTELGSEHICLLNKFNVVDHHLLIITREFEPQTNLICQQDFAALALCLQQIDGLGFYNGGTEAGASQPHKHLQLIPLPMQPFARLPLHSSLSQFKQDEVTSNTKLPFRHAGIALSEKLFNDKQLAAEKLTETYLQLIKYLSIKVEGETVIMPYNLLITREWMMMVPRSREDFAGISLNALAFCGALLVRNPDQEEQLKSAGIANALKSVTA
ncbi:MAG: DUF4922 domain-containing protein [Amphritea sp.]